MIWIIEGPDWVGKTTLATQLSQRLNVPIHKSERTPLRGKMTTVQSQAEDMGAMELVRSAGLDVIFDRFFPSEYAYGQLRKGFDAELFWRMDDELAFMARREQAVPVMVLHSNLDHIATTRRDGHTSLEEVRLAQQGYQEYLRESKVNWSVLRDDGRDVGWHVEQVMLRTAEYRPSRDRTYIELAREASKRSTCISRRNGAVLVSARGHVLSTGYNGSPSGMPHPRSCPRLTGNVGSGDSLEMCNDVHSEANCIAQAAQQGGDTMGGTLYTLLSPCFACAQLVAAAALSCVVYEKEYGDRRGLELLEAANIETRSMT